MKKKTRKPNKHQQIISRFVTVDISESRNKHFWSSEMKFAGRLIKKYTFEFLIEIPPPEGYKVESLLWFLSSEGGNYLNDQYFEYKKRKTNLVEERKEIVLSTEKVGEDIKINRKPRTVKDFLNLNYGKKESGQ